MSSDVIISVEKLSKRYRLGEIGATTLRDSVERWWHRVRGRDPNEHMGEVGQAARLRPAGSAGQEKRQAASGKREELGVTPSSLTSPAPQRALRSAAGLPSVKNSGSLTEDNKGNEERAEESPVELSNSPISESSNHRIPESDELWALKDVSFEVKRGEVLGIIGRNGAGKSTLLKILSRITEPTSGRAVLRGRVGSLLEVGTGFHPELSGRDNIYLNGAILGMKRAEITRKFDEIVAFAEVERFIDTPVKRYSSGMYVRLAFAVAAHLDPEILLVDEVLAVGDFAFQRKCLGKLGEVAQGGKTVLFVSHNMTAVRSLCHRIVQLDCGCILRNGPVTETIHGYLCSESEDVLSLSWDDASHALGNDKVSLSAMCLTYPGHDDRQMIFTDTPLQVSYGFTLKSNVEALTNISTSLLSTTGEVIFTVWSDIVSLGAGHYEGKMKIPGDLLNDGSYSLDFMIVQDGRPLFHLKSGLRFSIHDRRKTDVWYGKVLGAIRPMLLMFPIRRVER